MSTAFESDYYALGLAHWLTQEIDHTAVPMHDLLKYIWLCQPSQLYQIVLVASRFDNPNLKAKQRRPRPIVGDIEWDKEQQRWYIVHCPTGQYLAGFWGGNVNIILVNHRRRQVVIQVTCAQLVGLV